MTRSGFTRFRRRAHVRLSLEHLESRRLMAGLNVYVFNDQDGSRSLTNQVDTPAANRLVYVDLNRDLRFEDGEPLAVSNGDGLASFPGLSDGDYMIGLAGNHPSQLLTTSVVPDALASQLSASTTQTIISSPDLRHAWAVSPTGQLSAIGTSDFGRSRLNLGGPLLAWVHGLSVAEGAAATTTSMASGAGTNSAWALVDQGLAQPVLVQLDLSTGGAKTMPVQGLATSDRVGGLVRAGKQVYLQISNGDSSFLGRIDASPDRVTLGSRIAVPNGQLVSSQTENRLAVIGTVAAEGGESASGRQQSSINLLQLQGGTAAIETLTRDRAVQSATFTADGQMLLAAFQGGGVEVLATSGTPLRSAAYLAEASGPIAAGARDGRIVTGNARNANELIVWDMHSWNPAGRTLVGATDQFMGGLMVDQFGEQVLVASSAGTWSARLANPAPQAVRVESGARAGQASLGVRLVQAAQPLPSNLRLTQSTEEDVPLSFDLASAAQLSGLSPGTLFFAPATSPTMGTLLVTPSGRVSYRAQANANGADSATVRVFDGVTTTTLVVSLNVTAVNDPPSAFTIDPAPISEFATSGVLAGFATVFDVDTDARYQIATNDARFVVADGQIVLSQGEKLDYESEPVIELEITATDLDNPAFVITRHIGIPVLDDNDAPTMVSLLSTHVSENRADAAVGQVQVTDPDRHGQYAVAVSDSRFEVVDGQLRLRPGATLDFETEPFIPVTITVTDPTADSPSQSTSATIMVEVVDNNDAPTGITISGTDLKSGEPGAIVGSIDVIDQDIADTYSFEVSDSRFIVDGNVLRLKDGESVAHETETMVTVLVTVADSGQAVVSQTITVNVVNDAPYQNPRNPLDVDNDGNVYPRDALILVNRLNVKGSHIITSPSATGEGGPIVENYYLDVNGDGMLTPLDVLIIINFLNRRGMPVQTQSATDGGNKGGNIQPQSAPGQSPGAQSPSVQSPSVQSPADEVAQRDAISAEGEGDDATYCNAWFMPMESSFANDKGGRQEREAIDNELETLVEQLSRARVRGPVV